MKPITLIQKHLNGNPLHLFPGWLSNGAWAIRRAQVVNSDLLTSIEQAVLVFPKLGAANITARTSDDAFDKLASSVEGPYKVRTWTVQPWTLTWRARWHSGKGPLQLALLTDRDSAAVAYVDRTILQLLQVEDGDTVVSRQAANSAFTTMDGDAVFMGVDASAEDHLTVFRSIIHLQDLEADQPTSDAAKVG
jgi:hypothetical protein